jgi:hypothetical protein
MVTIAKNTDFLKRTSAQKIQKLARFKTVRNVYSKAKNILQHIQKTRLQESRDDIFSTPLEQQKCLKQVLETAIYTDVNLRQQIVDEIYDFAIANLCVEPKNDITFYAADVDNKNETTNFIYRGLVTNTSDCPAIAQITHNNQLLEIAHKFLGYYPTEITQHLTWSFAAPQSEKEIQKVYPPTNWHYDVAGMNFVTASFYITDVLDMESGPHVLIPGSQKNIPLSMLMRSNIQDERKVLEHYGADSQVYLMGKAGFGFIEDPSCLHKVKPPTKQNRLILQIRYS